MKFRGIRGRRYSLRPKIFVTFGFLPVRLTKVWMKFINILSIDNKKNVTGLLIYFKM